MAVTAKKVKENDAIKAADHNSLVDDIKTLDKTAAKGPKGNPGVRGKKGADAKQIKAGVINEDKNGIVTGAKVTFTDNTTVDFSVSKATE